MYEEYFGLKRSPFKITPDTSLFYEGGRRGDILAALVYAIHRGEGIIKVVGEVGSGKTMLCRMLQLKLPDTVEIVYIANPSVSADDILFVIAHELSLPIDKDGSKYEVMRMLQDYLLQRHIENKQVVLFVEEAQGMPLETLEEIRLLSNLETDQNKLLQIILFGQPELDENLAKKSIRQLRERITHQFNLEPLGQDEIYNYLNFRMREVGYTGPELVNRAVAKKIEQYSAGLLRRINIIADKILLAAFSEGTHNLIPRHVMAAVNDSSFGDAKSKKSSVVWWLLSLLLLALVFALVQARSGWNPLQTASLAKQPQPVTKSGGALKPNRVNPPSEIDSVLSAAPSSEPLAGPAVVDEPLQISTREDEQVVVQPAEIDNDPPAGVIAVTPEVNATKTQQLEATTAAKPVAEVATIDPEPDVMQKALSQSAANDLLTTAAKPDLDLTGDYNQWLNAKLEESRVWLSHAKKDNVSIQVMMSHKSAARQLVDYLRHDWPLDLSKTYLYEVDTSTRSIYRVFYSEFHSMSEGREEIQRLPESLRSNSPYLHSVYRMQKALL